LALRQIRSLIGGTRQGCCIAGGRRALRAGDVTRGVLASVFGTRTDASASQQAQATGVATNINNTNIDNYLLPTTTQSLLKSFQ
jgi:hypothetical protein